ncbi:putative Transmembrane protein [Seiridium cardinale]|uniref:Transmembrane protein n=1 Tax=Seiridium cardinale TaxID=138064 RepID=A0ABR2XER4_9PEZI
MWDCNELQRAVESRSDIENVWTLVIFFAPSCLAVAALLVQYLLLHTPFVRSAPWDASPVDVVVLQWVRNAFRRIGLGFRDLDQPSQDNGLQAVFDQFMMSLGDIHIGFGIAIIGYGFASLPRGIAAYDWWCLVGLAWIAVITNMAMLSCLRDYYRHNPAKRDWRLCLVFAMVAVLAFCMVPIGWMKQAMSSHGEESRHDILTANVLCFFPGRGHALPSEELSQLMLGWSTIAGFLIIMAALAVAVMVLERPEGILRKWCNYYRGEPREPSSDQLVCARCEQRFVLLVMRPFVAFWLVLRAHLDLLNSVLVEITCTAALFLWIMLRFRELLQLQPFQAAETTLTFAHCIAFVTLLAPLKPVVEYICMTWRNSRGLAAFKSWVWWRKPDYQFLPAVECEGNPTGDGRVRCGRPEVTIASAGTSSSQGNTSSRRRAGITTPMHFKFYLDTAWYVKALPVAGVSGLVQLVLMFVLPMTEGRPTVEVLLQLAPWYVVFAPLQVLLFILAAMITEEREGSSEGMRRTYWALSAVFGVLSTAVVVDTVYGLGGYPMSYFGMATLGLMVVAHLLYGCVSKPGKFVKGKGTNSDDIDEESALLGSRTQIKIPVRRPKHLHGPSRRLAKQSIKTYGTMVKPVS